MLYWAFYNILVFRHKRVCPIITQMCVSCSGLKLLVFVCMRAPTYKNHIDQELYTEESEVFCEVSVPMKY